MQDTERNDLEIVFAPDYTEENPYQAKLKQELEELGASVQLSSGLSPGLLRDLANKNKGILHLHWLFPYFQSDTRLGLVWNSVWFLLKLLFLKMTGVTIVWTAHDYITHSRKNERFSKKFRRTVFTLFDSVIVHCEAAKGRLHDEYSLDKSYNNRITTVFHPHFLHYPNEIKKCSARKKLGLGHNERVFVFFGNIKKYKGVGKLIDEFKRLRNKNARLYLAGSTTKETKTKVTRAINNNPSVLGDLHFIPADEIQIYLNAADVVVLPFRDILTSGSIVLAMSFGKPIIAPAIGCIPETVADDGALLYDPNSDDGLYNALREANNSDLSAMGERNRERIKKFDWETAAKKTMNMYRSIE